MKDRMCVTMTKRELALAVLAALTLALAMCLAAPAAALAEPTEFWTAPGSSVTPDSNLIKTFGVRDGSAGPDFLGITNTNFDFTHGNETSNDQYDVPAGTFSIYRGAGIAIWATSVNEYANPYYQNLWYNKITTGSTAPQATTWMSNPKGSWGDSNNSKSNKGNVSTGTATIAGLEYSPEIIFGANKLTNWANASADGSGSDTYINDYLYSGAEPDYDPTWISNDATNIWTQVYTMNRLADVAQDLKTGTSKITRYDSNNANVSALNYEKAIRGNLLYIASQIYTTPAVKKTVAYLYAIDTEGVGYFFTPTAAGLLSGNDTGKSSTSTPTTPDTNYAANNATIDMGYMATLPFVTNTFDSGIPVTNSGGAPNGIIMEVEDIYKASPACKVAASSSTVLANVDVIIYNTTTLRGANLIGTQAGRNSSNISMASDYSLAKVQSWASDHGFAPTGTRIIAGDDFSTSNYQGFEGTAPTDDGMSPQLYCQRNYTADKNARAAWAFAQVYPALYNNNPNATYAYWVDKIYHVNIGSVPAVAAYMLNKSTSVTYDATTAADLETKFAAGRTWWENTGKSSASWSQFAYYSGSSRASYYSGA